MLILVKLSSTLTAEIIWNLGHFEDNSEKRITLAQNPQFYDELDELPSSYSANFFYKSTYEYDEEQKVIFVLTKNSHEVLPVFECVPPRALDNIWFTYNTIIVRGLFLSFLFLSSTNNFLDTRGNLFGESAVPNSITATKFKLYYHWHRVSEIF
jgi:hypothetical protein